MGKSYAELKLLFGDDRIHLAKALSKPEVDTMARGYSRQIAATMKNRPRDIAQTWVDSANALGATVHKMADDDENKGKSIGYYCWRTKRIIYDPSWDEWTICHTLCHELTHHLICHSGSGSIRNGIERFDDNRETLQHRIARKVQEIMLG